MMKASRRMFLSGPLWAAMAAGCATAGGAERRAFPGGGPSKGPFRVEEHEAGFCVVGGGMAGLCAALAAARHGAKVVLMQDRPVLGGNASSECRVHVCGADRHNGIPNMRETGILEELRMENLFRNPQRSFSIWDTVLYEAAKKEPNLTLLLNCSCVDAEMREGQLISVTGWRLTTQTIHTIKADIFADCSGDSILAPLTGAEYRMGREGRTEYGESIAPEQADERTMGMTCLFQSRRHDTPQPFTPYPWANTYERCEDLPYGPGGHKWWEMGYWWVELGGDRDTIHDSEDLRDELLKTVYGVWDHIKNRCPNREGAANLALDWVQFLPGRRESRRYMGAHVLTQGDIEAGGKFADTVAYGGWSMDDHHPAGFQAVRIGAPATIFHAAPSPYGIPYGGLYSRSIPNLMFAGRNASCTHTAMSSTRVMGTCSVMGQAVGTAAALALREGMEPTGVAARMTGLQQLLLRDDCFLPGFRMEMPVLTATAKLTASSGNPEPVRDGVTRPFEGVEHCWHARPGESLTYEFDGPRDVEAIHLVLDSALDKTVAMSHLQPDDQLTHPPACMPKAFRIETRIAGSWGTLVNVEDNHQRLRYFPVERQVDGVRFTMDTLWGETLDSRVFAFWVE